MNKKSAFTVVAELSVKMGFIKECSVINVLHVVSDLQVVTGLNKMKSGSNTSTGSKLMSSLPPNTTVPQKLFSEK